MIRLPRVPAGYSDSLRDAAAARGESAAPWTRSETHTRSLDGEEGPEAALVVHVRKRNLGTWSRPCATVACTALVVGLCQQRLLSFRQVHVIRRSVQMTAQGG